MIVLYDIKKIIVIVGCFCLKYGMIYQTLKPKLGRIYITYIYSSL